MKTFTEAFNTILTADEETSRQAAREVRKLVYSSDENEKYKCIASIIENAPAEYIKIVENWRQENFVMAISVMYFLHNRKNQPDFLFPWLFQLLQHKNGNIRHSAVRMIEHELGSLTYHIRFPGEKISRREPSPEQADRIIFGLRTNLNNLATSFWKDSYRKFKYLDRLPSGTYKSVQLILSFLDDYCGEAPYQQIPTESKQPLDLAQAEQIFKRRKEIEQELMDMLKETGSDFTLEDVKELIYNEEDNDDLHKLIAMFDPSSRTQSVHYGAGRGGDATELSNVLELVTDAWNYFPHQVLGGISPAEKLLEYKQK